MLKGNRTDKHHGTDRLERKKERKEEEEDEEKGKKERKKERKKTRTESEAHGRFSLYFFIFDVRKPTKHAVSAANSVPCSRLAN